MSTRSTPYSGLQKEPTNVTLPDELGEEVSEKEKQYMAAKSFLQSQTAESGLNL